jgi:hypothetical protein
MGTPAYRGRPYHQFGLGHCKVLVDILANPTDPTMTAWFTMARGDDLVDTLERAAHKPLMEFCERHLLVLDGTTIALLLFGMRATRCGVSMWLLLATSSF